MAFTLTKGEIFEIFRQCKPANNKPPDLDLAIETISGKLAVVDDVALKTAVQNLLKTFTRYNQKQRLSVSSSRNNENLSEIVIKSEHYTPLPSPLLPSPPPAKKRKSFISASRQSQLNRSENILQRLKKFIDEENVDVPSKDNLTLTQLLGFLIHRINYHENRKLSDIGLSIFEKKLTTNDTEFDNLDAIALMHDLTLTKSQMRNVKSYLGKKNVSFPNTNDLLDARKQLKPDIKTELEGDGVSVNYTELIEMTTISIINTLKQDESVEMDASKPLLAVYKDGCDGAGSQSRWNSRSMSDASDHMFQYSVVPLRLEQEGKTLWKNPTPNAANCTRPVYLLRASEDEQRVLDLVIPATDAARKELEICRNIVDSNGDAYNVVHKIHDTMKDLKLKKKWSGLGGADCIICASRKKDWMDPEKIVQGFPITRSASSSMELYEQLIFEGNGEIVKKPHDYEKRTGLTTEPLTCSDQHSITILHSYINVLGWFLKLVYRCHTSYECWVEKTTVIGEPIRRARDTVKRMLNETTGMTLDQVAGANDKGGTSNDGNQARRFFKPESRDFILQCVNDKYKDIISLLHKNLSVILGVISNSSEVNCDQLDKLTKETSLLIAESLPWVSINFTLHRLLHHSVELIVLNNNWSLGSLSEEALESTNKFVRRYLEQFSRKISPVDQMKDAMSRLIERSDPKVILHQRQFKNLRFCTKCNSSHHMTKNHHKYTDRQKKATVENEYDSLVLSILIQSQSNVDAADSV